MKNDDYNVLIAILVIAFIWALFFHKQRYNGYTAEEWFNEYVYCKSDLDDYKNALEEANNNIEEASSHAWESYDEMGEALENLYVVEP